MVDENVINRKRLCDKCDFGSMSYNGMFEWEFRVSYDHGIYNCISIRDPEQPAKCFASVDGRADQPDGSSSKSQ